MRDFGEVCLLAAFAAAGFAAFVHLTPAARAARGLRRGGMIAAWASVAALTAVIGILAAALFRKDFSYDYVAQYSSRHLSWYYSVSALWVGQAGSLLLWAWLLGVLALIFRGRGMRTELRDPAFGLLMGYMCFLAAILVFAADPMASSISGRQDGVGLSPLLQHPAMLMHPPIVFLGYALWTMPFALAVAALLSGRLDTDWVRLARPWALLAWLVLGAGILLGAQWAYEELGWGGYWGWDPVENGSLLPWLTGTALIHALMAWQYRGAMKRTAVVLAFVTFGLCNFATFLTRSGIFSSLHAFSQSPIGWLFLALMIGLLIGGAMLFVRRRGELTPDRPLGSTLSREALIVVATVALLLLTAVVIGGTLSSALTSAIAGEMILVGPEFYNRVLVPTGLVLLLATAMAPLLRWGQGPTTRQARGLLLAAAAGMSIGVGAAIAGIRSPLFLVVIGASSFALAALAVAIWLDAARWPAGNPVERLGLALSRNRRQYAGFLIHVGFVSIAIGITGSSLGTRQQDATLYAGQAVDWGERQVHLIERRQRELPDKLIAEAELEIVLGGRHVRLVPARHFHRLNQIWTTEVAIDSTWRGDTYVILHGGEHDGRIDVTLIDNPLMRWIWFGGWLAAAGVLIRLWPLRRKAVVTVATIPDSVPQRAAA